MRVAVLPSGPPACQHYRLRQPARCVREAVDDVDVTVIDHLDVDADVDTHGRHTVRAASVPGGADVLVLQNTTDHVWAQSIPLLQQAGVAVVLDVDDAYDALALRNHRWRALQPQHNPLDNHAWLSAAAAAADLVTVTTPALTQHYVGRGVRGVRDGSGAVVLPNLIARMVTQIDPAPRPADQGVRVGWSGTLQTHPDDLQTTGRGIAQALRDAGRGGARAAGFRVVGDAAGVCDALGLSAAIDVRDTGWVPLARYHQRVADTIDIGVVPLLDTTFNRAKSALKLLEFSALGIPTIAAPTPANREIGLAVELAETPVQWRRALSALLREADAAAELGARARQQVRTRWLAEDHAHLWVDAWRGAAERAAQRRGTLGGASSWETALR